MSQPTQHRSVRVPDDVWAEFGAAAAEHGGRASVLRRLVTLFLTDRAIRRRVTAYGDDLARAHRVVDATRPTE